MNPYEQLSRSFLKQARKHLEEDCLPKIRKCAGLLSEEEIWWRPNENSNSVGNMILHLSGNVRQWIISGVGKAPDTRVRSEEFSKKGPIPAGELMNRLESTIQEALLVMERVEPASLLQVRRIQAYDVDLLQAIFHVVEHFSNHTGQIIYVTKLLKNEDLSFYRL